LLWALASMPARIPAGLEACRHTRRPHGQPRPRAQPSTAGPIRTARVYLTPYEIERRHLPPVCVRCGRPTSVSVERRVPLNGGPWTFCQVLGLMIGAFLFPPLFLWVHRRLPAVHLRLPFCADDQVRYARQERLAVRILAPLWVAFSLAVTCYSVVAVWNGVNPAIGLAWAGVFIGAATFDAVEVWTGRRSRRTKGLPLAFVHPAFVAALLEDRARDRVSNPDRRGGPADVRADYDDEPG
jgi:hypothetical protein